VLYERGCRIPQDISVVSVDNTVGPYLAPVLTEACHPGELLGRKAVELIVEQCRNEAAGKPGRSRKVTLQPELLLGASTRIIGQPERDLS
jgi:DNA-binding LacI/PurR family transcriptional regulator